MNSALQVCKYHVVCNVMIVYRKDLNQGVCMTVCFHIFCLQCLSNTQPLTEYFFDDYQKHINRNNRPLGTDGAIAEAYGALIKEMWSGQVNHVLPHRMKVCMIH